ncbi:hypothetical protein H5407_11055 [Mitsuaria sp. WAJ17]|uniref:hypothetical protein n=1 Tax=Mitsuaria sp. WAJ17 TaxID=2761452 RepID=UPI001600C667|nr:hypothetical protein [Mitsuaria sp. WAJ17]MBB2485757.1 hypothetical protein [Mitsuaria sp. WAJ17]
MNTHRVLPSSLSLLTTALLLSACGGGGGSAGPDVQPLRQPLAITSSNYQMAAAQGVGAGTYMMSAGAGNVLGVDAQALPQPLWIAQQQAQRLAERFKQAQGTAVVLGATTTVMQNCRLGGSVEVTVNDANGNQILDSGDSMAIKASGCRESEGTLDGTMDYALKSVTGSFGSSQYSATIAVKLGNLRVANAGGTMTGQGEFQMTVAATGVGSTSVAMSIPSFSTSGTAAGSSFQSTITGFNLNVSTTPSGSGYRSTLTYGGTVNSTALESRDITVSTPVALVKESSLSYPSSGQVLVKGAGGSQVRVTVQGGGKALVELDANGDNVFETSITKNWADLQG